VKRCPKCRLANLDESQLCECGFDFVNPKLASPWSRLGAQSIDGLVAVLILLLPTFISQRFAGMGLILFVLYYLLADAFPQGQSVGKRFYKIAVVEKESGKPCSFFRSAIRNLTQILSVLDWVWIFGSSHTRLGDILAQTRVVRLR
jgi:uncharacterized RDD family membrane protein YckC